jgi:hypothetical protein
VENGQELLLLLSIGFVREMVGAFGFAAVNTVQTQTVDWGPESAKQTVKYNINMNILCNLLHHHLGPLLHAGIQGVRVSVLREIPATRSGYRLKVAKSWLYAITLGAHIPWLIVTSHVTGAPNNRWHSQRQSKGGR